MTQKELLYFEDAVGHEGSIIKLLNIFINNLTDEKLIKFMKEELQKHENLKQNLMNKLGEKTSG